MTRSIIWICQGPPRCDLTGDDAVADQTRQCPWCIRVMTDVDEDGHYTEERIEPGEA